MSCYFGLYFGNTNMCLAMHKESKTDVLANAAGYRVTPAVIAFLSETEKVVGLDAKQAMKRNDSNTVTNIKNLIISNDVKEESSVESISNCKMNGKKCSKLDLETKDYPSQYEAVDLLAILFTNMKEIARSHSHEDVYPAVVTVPLTFTTEHRESVRRAVTKAGFHVLRIINEPCAAVLAYNIGQALNDANTKCLVFRMGETSLDVTIFQVTNGMYSKLSFVQKKNFGGFLVTNCIIDFCASEFQRQYKIDIKESKRSLMKLRTAAEHYKHVVYSSTSEKCQVESLYDGIDLNVNISKARFDSLIRGTLQRCLGPIKEALDSASLSVSDINTVILTGGSCKIPKLQQFISNMFPSASVLSNIIPDEVFAVGAAKQATLITQTVDVDDYCINLLSRDLSIKLTGFSNFPEELLLCSNGTLIPTVITQSFSVKQNSNLKVELFEGTEAQGDNAKSLLAVLNMPNLPLGDIYFTFHIKSDGSVCVTCKDCSSKEIGCVVVVPPQSQAYCT